MGITAHVQAEFKWITDVSFFGKVEVFTNPEGTGTPIVTRLSVDPAGQPVAALIQGIIVPVGPALAPDTGYFFRVTATDPTGNNPDLVTPTPLPPFFTGTQAISSVSVAPDINSAVISWTANVIGYGSVVYGTTSLNQGPVEDTYNITDHAIQLTGLSAGRTYQFQVCNKHAIRQRDVRRLSGKVAGFYHTLRIQEDALPFHAGPLKIDEESYTKTRGLKVIDTLCQMLASTSIPR